MPQADHVAMWYAAHCAKEDLKKDKEAQKKFDALMLRQPEDRIDTLRIAYCYYKDGGNVSKLKAAFNNTDSFFDIIRWGAHQDDFFTSGITVDKIDELLKATKEIYPKFLAKDDGAKVRFIDTLPVFGDVTMPDLSKDEEKIVLDFSGYMYDVFFFLSQWLKHPGCIKPGECMWTKDRDNFIMMSQLTLYIFFSLTIGPNSSEGSGDQFSSDPVLDRQNTSLMSYIKSGLSVSIKDKSFATRESHLLAVRDNLGKNPWMGLRVYSQSKSQFMDVCDRNMEQQVALACQREKSFWIDDSMLCKAKDHPYQDNSLAIAKKVSKTEKRIPEEFRVSLSWPTNLFGNAMFSSFPIAPDLANRLTYMTKKFWLLGVEPDQNVRMSLQCRGEKSEIVDKRAHIAKSLGLRPCQSCPRSHDVGCGNYLEVGDIVKVDAMDCILLNAMIWAVGVRKYDNKGGFGCKVGYMKCLVDQLNLFGNRIGRVVSKNADIPMYSTQKNDEAVWMGKSCHGIWQRCGFLMELLSMNKTTNRREEEGIRLVSSILCTLHRRVEKISVDYLLHTMPKEVKMGIWLGI